MAKKSINIRAGFDMAAFRTSSQNLQKSLRKTGKEMEAIGKSMSMALTAPIAGLAALSVFNFDKQAKSVAQVEAGLRSTGGAVGFVSKELQDMASALQSNSLFGDEDILKNVTAQLLTFTNITGKAFEGAQQVVLDYASRTGRDLMGTSVMIGKALNDPIAGLSALGKAGVQFTDEQKAVIKSLVDGGDAAKAQAIILKELETQYGGSAAAAAAAGMGPMQQLKNSIMDTTEAFGEIIVEALNPFIGKLKELTERFNSLNPETKKIIAVALALTAAIGPLIFAIGALNTALAFLVANPVVAVIVALGVAFVALEIAASESVKIFADVQKAVDVAKEAYGKMGEEIAKINQLKGKGTSASRDEIAATILSTKATLEQVNALIKENIERKKLLLARKNEALDSAVEASKGMDKGGNVARGVQEAKQLERNIALINAEIKNLQSQGGKAVDGLIDLEAQLETLGQKSGVSRTIDGVTNSVDKLKISINEIKGQDLLDKFAPVLKEIKIPEIKPIDLKVHLNKSTMSQAAIDLVDGIKTAGIEAKMTAIEIGEEIGKSITQSLNNFAADGLAQFGQMLGSVMSGGDMTAEDFGRGLLDSIANFMVQLGGQMLAIGIANAELGASIAMGPAGAPLAIKAGAALIIAGSAIAAINKAGIKGSAPPPSTGGGGGGNFGSQMGQMDSMMLETRISGRDLILVTERQNAFTR